MKSKKWAKLHGELAGVAQRNEERKQKRAFARKRVSLLLALRQQESPTLNDVFRLFEELELAYQSERVMGVTQVLSAGCPTIVFGPNGAYIGKDFNRKKRGPYREPLESFML